MPGRKHGLAVDAPGLVIAMVVLTADIHHNTAGIVLLDQVVAHGAELGIDAEIVERSPGRADGVRPRPRRELGRWLSARERRAKQRCPAPPNVAPNG